MGRAHVKVVLQTIVGWVEPSETQRYTGKTSDEGEALRYRTAGIGVLVGFILIMAISVSRRGCRSGLRVYFSSSILQCL